MTPISALDILRHPQSGDNSDINEAIQCAISALRKQIPKKVVEKEFVEDVSLNYCPCCNIRFIGWGMKHCGECGQALLWESEE